ncbi:MAG: LON peptidase substrate-binding domain-containing protein, partial [Planctomycetales bacterium]|nr:LON peptidase substrate-binding domain-containing protein [Planctomycetales bacterium]
MPIDDFNGIARLFPLPDLVMFPQVVQPIRIFEPRYLELLHDALETDRLIAMATLMPGWEAESNRSPPIHRAVCLGHIMSETQTDDGNYNVFLAGVSRGLVIEEIPSDTSFRMANIELQSDIYEEDQSHTEELQTDLVTKFRSLMPKSKTTDDL